MKHVRVALLIAVGAAGMARALPLGSFEFDVANDERRRGISWSDGKPTASARLTVPAGQAVSLDARVAALRGSPRHGGADAVVDAGGRYRFGDGPLRLDVGGTYHAFVGARGALDYVEATAEAGMLLGPAEVMVFGEYAPRQKAIGGDNLHYGAATSIAVVGTPFTLNAAIGRSTGSVRDPARSARLRPGGGYTDWQAGVTATRGPFSLGAALVGTSGARGPHTGERLVVRLGAAL